MNLSHRFTKIAVFSFTAFSVAATLIGLSAPAASVDLIGRQDVSEVSVQGGNVSSVRDNGLTGLEKDAFTKSDDPDDVFKNVALLSEPSGQDAKKPEVNEEITVSSDVKDIATEGVPSVSVEAPKPVYKEIDSGSSSSPSRNRSAGGSSRSSGGSVASRTSGGSSSRAQAEWIPEQYVSGYGGQADIDRANGAIIVSDVSGYLGHPYVAAHNYADGGRWYRYGVGQKVRFTGALNGVYQVISVNGGIPFGREGTKIVAGLPGSVQFQTCAGGAATVWGLVPVS